ncbi:MAG: M14 family zinc carboxypeptidase [Acidobacteriota bacterium]
MRSHRRPVPAALAVLLLASPAALVRAADPVESHPEWDAAYTAAIRAATTAPEFHTDLVDHLPSSATVPSPLAHHGYVAGAPDRLTYAADIHAYMRALDAASPRVAVFGIGTTEEGREMIAVAVADEATIAALDEYKALLRELADPRRVSEERARELIRRGKPVYYLTGGLHSPETGSPEMLMELAFRLAVEETPLIRSIRENVITLITPVLEVDGRERMVDLWNWRQAEPGRPFPRLAYWGKYVAHDNNRDAIGLSLALTRNLLASYLEWRPQVLHDLHESVPFLYISSGTGPYNAWLDPLTIGEWQRMAFSEVQALTAKGLPGVWTHGFYDGWAPNYLFWIGMGRNSVGRFYETFGNLVPSTEDRVVRGQSDRAWYRPNPPLPQVRWSLRNNVNFQQSGVLLALADMASRRQGALELFWRLGTRSVAKARTEGPAAYVFPAGQPRRGQLHDLMALLRRHGIEVHVATKAFSVRANWPPATENPEGASAPSPAPSAGTREFPAGSVIVRMDQPFSRLADALLDTQYVRGEEKVYDDTGWTLGHARNLEWNRVADTAVLDVPMLEWTGSEPAGSAMGGAALAIANSADTDLARLRAALPGVRMTVASGPFDSGRAWPAGTVIVPLEDATRADVLAAVGRLHLDHARLSALPVVETHELRVPRVALLHTWLSTQDEGWFRLALEDLGIPYEYLSTQDVAGLGDLRRRYDVILFPPAGGSPQDIVEGLPDGPALPWRRTLLTPNLGVDETDDMRPGLGLDGVRALARFVEEGGLLIAVRDAARFAVTYGLARHVSVVEPENLKARGALVRASVTDPGSPVTAGYGETVPVHFPGGFAFRLGSPDREDRDARRPSGRGGTSDLDVPQGRPYVAVPERPKPAPGEEGFQPPENLPFFYGSRIPRPADRPRPLLSLPGDARQALLSGMLEGADEIAGRALVVDAPRGTGHVLLFACNPMWRGGTQGSYALVTNALFAWDRLHLGRPASP